MNARLGCLGYQDEKNTVNGRIQKELLGRSITRKQEASEMIQHKIVK